MKRRIEILLFLLLIINNTFALGESDTHFFDLMEEYVKSFIDCSNIDPVDLHATSTDPKVYTMIFDFREGNNNIMSLHNEKCRIYYPVKDDELLSALIQFVPKFEEIEGHIPEDGVFEVEVYLSDDKEKIVISRDTDFAHLYSWIP